MGAADVENWLGLKGIDTEVLEAIAKYMKLIAPMLPQELSKAVEEVEMPDISPFAMLLGKQFGRGLTGFDFLPSVNLITSSLLEVFESLNLSGLGENLREKFNISDDTFIKGFQAVGAKAGKSVTEEAAEGMLEDTQALLDSCNILKSDTEGYLKSTFAGGFNVVTRINFKFHANYENLPTVFNAKPHTSWQADTNEQGGIIPSKRLSWVGEEGPEAIIPLIPSRRQRAIDLYEQTGRMLGIGRHAEGGIIGSAAGMCSGSSLATENIIQFPQGIDLEPYRGAQEPQERYSVGGNSVSVSAGAGTGGGNNITVEVHLTQQFDINATDRSEQELKRMIKNTVSDMTDDLGVALAEKVTEAFGNMPKAKIV